MSANLKSPFIPQRHTGSIKSGVVPRGQASWVPFDRAAGLRPGPPSV